MDGIRHVAFLPVNKVCASCPSRGFLSALVLAALFWRRWFVLSYPHLSPLKCLMEDALLGVSNIWCEHVALQLGIGGHQRPRGWLLVLAETVRTTQRFNSKCGGSQTALLQHLKKNKQFLFHGCCIGLHLQRILLYSRVCTYTIAVELCRESSKRMDLICVLWRFESTVCLSGWGLDIFYLWLLYCFILTSLAKIKLSQLCV